MHCPKCRSDKKVRNGKVFTKQRYKCKECGCSYTQSHKNGYSLEKRLLALQLYLEGNGFWGSGRILKVSNVTVLNWIRNFGKNIKEYVLENMPNDIRDIEIVEIDEMWHFTVKKNENSGPWIAIDRFDQEVIAYTVGGRSKKALKKLLRLLRRHRITRIATDGFNVL